MNSELLPKTAPHKLANKKLDFIEKKTDPNHKF